MKLVSENHLGLNLVTGYGADHLIINKVRHDGNLLLSADRIVGNWAPGGFESLSANDFGAVLELSPEVVIVGTGARQRFPAPQLLRPLIEAGVGFEIMDLAAACRTYNILASEGRAVAAALIVEQA